MSGDNPTIDERIAAIAQNVELLSVNVHALQDAMRESREREERLDARERRGRQAILAAIAAYLNELDGEH